MEPHMIDNELYSLVFVIWINHVGFINIDFKICLPEFSQKLLFFNLIFNEMD